MVPFLRDPEPRPGAVKRRDQLLFVLLLALGLLGIVGAAAILGNLLWDLINRAAH